MNHVRKLPSFFVLLFSYLYICRENKKQLYL